MYDADKQRALQADFNFHFQLWKKLHRLSLFYLFCLLFSLFFLPQLEKYLVLPNCSFISDLPLPS